MTVLRECERVELERQIGQMLMVGFRGLSVEEGDPILRDIAEYGVGTVVLFDFDVTLGKGPRNIASLPQVEQLVAALQARSEREVLVCVDQEGGRVCRLKEDLGFPALPSAQALGAIDDGEETGRLAGAVARALADLGIRFNLAPVVDVNRRPDNPVIGGKERSFSADVEVVISQARSFVEAHRRAGVLCALKHFPGHGSSSADSHLGVADVSATWSHSELDPYRRLLGEGIVDAVMTAHVFHRGLDPNHPATLSSAILQGILRDELGFDGVVVSDDMQMGAIANHYGFEQALGLAIEAGVDMIALANNTLYEPDIVPRAVAAIADMVAAGQISRDRIETSCRRIEHLRAGLEKRA